MVRTINAPQSAARLPFHERATAGSPGQRVSGPSLVGALLVWALLAAVTTVIFATYSRLPAAELATTVPAGVARGARRALIFVNFPVALIAIALAIAAAARLDAGLAASATLAHRLVTALAGLAIVLCLVATFPGVVRMDALAVGPINALPALGVLIALGLAAGAVTMTGISSARSRTIGDMLRFAAGVVLAILALPWALADLGVYAGDVPLLGTLFLSRQVAPGETDLAVHLGHHHGIDGVLLAITALVLLPALLQIGRAWLRRALAGYLALMFDYGLANAAQDFWYEQIVRRGWVDTRIPDVLWPAATPAWGLMLLAAIAVWPIILLALPARDQAASGTLAAGA